MAVLFSGACAPAQPPALTLVRAYASPGAMPWLQALYTCAEEENVAIELTADAPDITLQVGEPTHLPNPAFQIGEEHLVIVRAKAGAPEKLSLQEARTLFAAENAAIQRWVYAPGVDLQAVFEREVMQGMPVSSQAFLARTPAEMAQALHANAGALGMLPGNLVTDDLEIMLELGVQPVLAIPREAPNEVLERLIACLQV